MANIWPQGRLSLGLWAFRITSSLILALSMLISASCGWDNSGKGEQGKVKKNTHSVPGWIVGNWKPVQMHMGGSVESENMMMTITPMAMNYRYPNCSVSGKLVMADNVPLYSANYYTLIMDEVNCPHQWDIPTFDGQEDYGKIWAESTGLYLYRISDKYWEPVWIYINMGGA